MLRPDKVIFSIKEYVTKHMGEEFINIPLFDMATSFAESSKTTPLILILSPGMYLFLLSPVLPFFVILAQNTGFICLFSQQSKYLFNNSVSLGCDPLASFHNFIPEDPEQRPVDRKILSLGQGQVPMFYLFTLCLHFL